MIFVIGDIHGEIIKLKRLINFIIKRDQQPTLIFVGDYLDKGLKVLESINYLNYLNEKYECCFLWGNHEYLWFNLMGDEKKISEYLLRYGGQSTINSFKKNNVYETHEILKVRYEAFFKILKPYWKNDNYIVTHSGIPPHFYNIDPSLIPLKELLFNRYDFIKMQSLFYNNLIVIFGHTGFYRPYFDSYKIGIDTSACYDINQPLTAYCLDLNVFIDSNDNLINLSELNNDSCPNIFRNKKI